MQIKPSNAHLSTYYTLDGADDEERLRNDISMAATVMSTCSVITNVYSHSQLKAIPLG